VVAESRYLPYGQERWRAGAGVTDFGFTSQRNERGFGLMDYNARYYSAILGRFISADTIVPEPGKSMALNRYMYVNGNPTTYS
jgi:RHS repeat-associated protein